jgi:hypothetical protein
MDELLTLTVSAVLRSQATTILLNFAEGSLIPFPMSTLESCVMPAGAQSLGTYGTDISAFDPQARLDALCGLVHPSNTEVERWLCTSLSDRISYCQTINDKLSFEPRHCRPISLMSLSVMGSVEAGMLFKTEKRVVQCFR